MVLPDRYERGGERETVFFVFCSSLYHSRNFILSFFCFVKPRNIPTASESLSLSSVTGRERERERSLGLLIFGAGCEIRKRERARETFSLDLQFPVDAFPPSLGQPHLRAKATVRSSTTLRRYPGVVD